MHLTGICDPSGSSNPVVVFVTSCEFLTEVESKMCHGPGAPPSKQGTIGNTTWYRKERYRWIHLNLGARTLLGAPGLKDPSRYNPKHPSISRWTSDTCTPTQDWSHRWWSGPPAGHQTAPVAALGPGEAGEAWPSRGTSLGLFL